MGVLNLEFHSESFDGGRAFGAAGPYELLSGTARFAFDPEHPRNRVITDLDLAPRGPDGRVAAAADFALLRPQDPARGNRRLLLDVLNRGNRIGMGMLDARPAAAPPGQFAVGDGWLLQRGYTVAWCGWQHDVPDVPGLLRFHAPEAREHGAAITGRLCVRFEVVESTTVQRLSDANHRPYPAADLRQPDAVLHIRDYPDDTPRVIPREQWRFARLDGTTAVPDAEHVHLPAGFLPGQFYEIAYTATGAVLTGLGLAATRDFVSFLRFASRDDGNPCAGQIDHALAFGASQSGAFLRTLLHLGLCEDEAGRLAFDGLLPHIAGAYSGEMNWRFGQPSYYGPHSLSYVFPHADAVLPEPGTGRRDGIQRRALERGVVPKVVYTNTSAEYWSLFGALTHTDLAGGDAPLPDHVRVYHFAGAQHGRGALPLTDNVPARRLRAVNPVGTVDYAPLLRAALVNLDRWATEGVAPPPSNYPRIADGTLVAREALAGRIARLPGQRLPEHVPAPRRLDYGPQPDGRWVQTQVPPRLGLPYLALVPAVDDDGSEVGGVRLPAVSVPLATHTGWNVRHTDSPGAGLILPLMGSTIPFARSAAERSARGDPRPSIAERYPGRDAYLRQVQTAADDLVRQRYLLDDNVPGVVETAAQHYDALTAP